MHRNQEKEDRILEFIKTFIQARGYCPTVREIQAEFQISTTSLVYHYLTALEVRGLVTWEAGKDRTIHPTIQQEQL